MKTFYAYFALIAVSAMWGLTFPFIETSMQDQCSDPLLFVSLRFSFAGLLLLPFFLKKISKALLIQGAVLGVFNTIAFISQTVGLQSISASRAAFITGANVIFIPFIAPFFKLKKPDIFDFISAGICLFGVYILTGANLSEVTLGDIWVILCALAVAMSIAYISYLGKKAQDPYALTASQIVLTALFSWVVAFFCTEFSFSSCLQVVSSTQVVVSICYCSLFATIATLGLQAKFQPVVTAQKAALLFSLEPVFAAFFDLLINNVVLETATLWGGGCILLSILLLEYWHKEPIQEEVKVSF